MSDALHEEEALGKAYDLRLLGRLWTYVRPYKLQVACTVLLVVPMFALEVASISVSFLQLLGFALGNDVPKPAAIEEPAAEVLQVQDLGLHLSLTESDLFWVAAGQAGLFCSTMALQEAVEWQKFLAKPEKAARLNPSLPS